MDNLNIEIRLTARGTLSEEEKQKVLSDIRTMVQKYLVDPPEFLDLTNVRIFKHMTNEEIANALLNRK